MQNNSLFIIIIHNQHLLHGFVQDYTDKVDKYGGNLNFDKDEIQEDFKKYILKC